MAKSMQANKKCLRSWQMFLELGCKITNTLTMSYYDHKEPLLYFRATCLVISACNLNKCKEV